MRLDPCWKARHRVQRRSDGQRAAGYGTDRADRRTFIPGHGPSPPAR
jgi:hypothetical protein